MNADGSNQQRITYEGGNYPCWSPDGSKIVYTKYSAFTPTEGNGRIWIMDTDGSNRRQLTGFRLKEHGESES
jgi:TolB protein